jgi:hypothetical protein
MRERRTREVRDGGEDEGDVDGGGGGSYVIHAREGTDALPFDRSVLPDKSVLPISPADLAIYFLISAKRARGASSPRRGAFSASL